MRYRLLLFLVTCSFALGSAQAHVLYRWVDRAGQTHFSDQPPPSSAVKVEKISFSNGEPARTAPVPYELSQAMKNAPVTLYTAPSCGKPCTEARELLDKRGVPFKEVPVRNPQTNAELKRVSGGHAVPVLSVGAEVQKGFSASAFNAALDVAGYPKAGLLPARSQALPAPRSSIAPRQRPQARAHRGSLSEEPQRALGPYAPH